MTIEWHYCLRCKRWWTTRSFGTIYRITVPFDPSHRGEKAVCPECNVTADTRRDEKEDGL